MLNKNDDIFPKPVFIDGDRESGWVIIYEYEDGSLKDGQNVFDTRKEAREIMKLGGEYVGEFAANFEKVLIQFVDALVDSGLHEKMNLV